MENEGVAPTVLRGSEGGTAGAWRSFIAVLAVVLFLTGIGLYAWHSGVRLSDLDKLGYPGVFVLTFISGAGTFVPNPYQAIVPVAGALWQPWLVGLAAGFGNGTGELLTYATGRTGGAVMRNRKPPPGWSTVRRWLARYGFFTILAIAVIPNPIFDAVALLSGSARYSIWRFWLATVLGNCIKYTAYAYVGDSVWARIG